MLKISKKIDGKIIIINISIKLIDIDIMKHIFVINIFSFIFFSYSSIVNFLFFDFFCF